MLTAPATGNQQPRIHHVPPHSATAGHEAVELAALAGLHLDPWQQTILTDSLAERDNGKWAAFEVALVCPRQNGKDGVLEARELAGLFLLGERLIIHSAHQFDTSLEHFRRLLTLIENREEFSRRVRRVSRSHGEEGIELKGGQRIRFRTRTKGGGRGFSGDLLLLNEAMILPEASVGALLPTMSARPNPQVWYAGSSVDRLVHEHGGVLARVRDRGLRGDDPALAYFEWSLPHETPDTVPAEIAADPDAWAESNPGLGIRISAEHIERERRTMDPRTFAVERLGVGDWPAGDGTSSIIDPELWEQLTDKRSTVETDLVFAFDITPNRTVGALAACGLRADGLYHVEIVDHKPGTGWMVERLVELTGKHQPKAVVCDGKSPAASLIRELTQNNVEPVVLGASEYAQACGRFFDLADQHQLRHLNTPELLVAVRGAAQRTLGDAWAWSRKTSGTDISPLVAVTLGTWAVGEIEKPKPPVRIISLHDA